MTIATEKPTYSYLAVKVRVYPDKRQQAILRQHIGHSRAIYNMALRKSIWEYHAALEAGEKPKSPTYFGLTAWLTKFKQEPGLEWLQEVPRKILEASVEHLATAYKNFFDRVKKGAEQPGFPKFKGHKSPRKARYKEGVAVNANGRKVKLPPKEFGYMPMRGFRPELMEHLTGAGTIEFSKSGRWFLVLRARAEHKPPVIAEYKRVAGVDLGLKDLLTIHDGETVEKIENPKQLAKHTLNLLRKQRKLSRKLEANKGARTVLPDGTRRPWTRRRTANVHVARVHERIANTREDYHNRIAYHLAMNYDVVVFESLQVKNMMKNKRLSKSIGDAGWSQLVTKVKQKMQQTGGAVVEIGKWYPSSKLCSACGVRKDAMELSERSWTCANCGAEHDRDGNAALNIRNEGIRILIEDGKNVTCVR